MSRAITSQKPTEIRSRENPAYTMATQKKSISELALFGGPPLFRSPLHVGRPNIGDRTVMHQYLDEIFDRAWLTNNGPLLQEFEQKIAEIIDVKHVIATSNATLGLEIAVRALNLTGEVILPSFTFIATAHALAWLGLTPVFCDVAEGSHNIGPAEIEKLITSRTTGILSVNIWGKPCDIDQIVGLGQEHNLKVLFDSAHAFACSYNERMIGNFGDCEVFSFHATKFLNTFEGGAITTNDDEIAERSRLLRNFGFGGYDQVDALGINAKMSEISAAMGLSSLECMGEFIHVNRRNYEEVCRLLEGVEGLQIEAYDDRNKNNFQYIVLEIDQEITDLDRDILMKILHAENVLVRRYFYPGCHKMEPYNSMTAYQDVQLPRTENLVQQTLLLPTGTNVSLDAIREITSLIKYVLENSAVIRERMVNEFSGR